MKTPTRSNTSRTGALRLLAGTGLLALAASLAQPAFAHGAPGQPRGAAAAGEPGDMGGMPGLGEMGGGMSGAHGAHGAYGAYGGPGRSGGRHGARALDSVGATAEQKTQLRQIMDSARADLKPLREAARGLHQQLRGLFAQPTVDANAAEALRQQLQANREQASKRMMQAMIESSRVLTPEQRKQLADRTEQRRSMMQRHRAEREALEGTPRRP
ncbi:MAG: Spy/CpxP family protein refolding chaperone [Rubrivivax sp.]|nr:Spy/CpxP family protein refolding chaperone [Rubrivivax sp.]